MAQNTQSSSNTSVDKYFDALTETYDAIIEAIKAGNERGFRLSNSLLAEAQRGQREAVDLGKKFAIDPTDIGGFYRAAMESTTRAQGRTLELARQIFDEFSDVRGETREAIEKVIKAQREAGEAAVEAVRDVAGNTAERVRTGVGRVTGQAQETVNEAATTTKKAAEKVAEATTA